MLADSVNVSESLSSDLLLREEKNVEKKMFVQRHHVYTTRKPREAPTSGPAASGGCLESVVSNFHPI